MKVNTAEYQDHEIFGKIDEYMHFYDMWSNRIFLFPTMGTTSFINIDTYVYASMHGTLESIKLVLKNGRINDAYALLRKFFDSVYINVYTILYLEDNFSIENLTVKQIQDWLQGKDQLPSTRTISDYIRKHKKLIELNDLLFHDKTYNELRDRCNDNAHYNFYKNVQLNNSQVHNSDRIKILDQISEDISHLLVMHLSMTFHLCEHYMMSSDYQDHIECNETPPKDCEYWVDNGVQNIFDSVIRTYRPDIAEFIKSNTAMHLE